MNRFMPLSVRSMLYTFVPEKTEKIYCICFIAVCMLVFLLRTLVYCLAGLCKKETNFDVSLAIDTISLLRCVYSMFSYFLYYFFLLLLSISCLKLLLLLLGCLIRIPSLFFTILRLLSVSQDNKSRKYTEN